MTFLLYSTTPSRLSPLLLLKLLLLNFLTLLSSLASSVLDVLSFRRSKHYGTGIENGTRTTCMRLRTPIPSYVCIASETLYVYYTGQTRTCRCCNRPGHEARQCNNFACFNWDELGHVASACSDSLCCSICKSTGHKVNHCPFALIDALNEKHSITTSLVRALESVPPSIASSSSDEQNAEHDDDEQDDGDRKYFRRRRHPTMLLNRIRTKH